MGYGGEAWGCHRESATQLVEGSSAAQWAMAVVRPSAREFLFALIPRRISQYLCN